MNSRGTHSPTTRSRNDVPTRLLRQGRHQAHRGDPSLRERRRCLFTRRRVRLPDSPGVHRALGPIQVCPNLLSSLFVTHSLYRQYFQEPAIPAGEFITRYPNRWSRYRYVLTLWAHIHSLTDISGRLSASRLRNSWAHLCSWSSVSVTTAKLPSAATRASLRHPRA